MSEPQSALGGQSYEGLVRIEESGLQGMITLRGDLASRALKSAATDVAGADMPGVNEIRGDGQGGHVIGAAHGPGKDHRHQQVRPGPAAWRGVERQQVKEQDDEGADHEQRPHSP